MAENINMKTGDALLIIDLQNDFGCLRFGNGNGWTQVGV